jgi:hypothetical protein
MNNLSQMWERVQGTLLPFLRDELDPITEKQERLIAIFEMVRIEDFIKNPPWSFGRPKDDRQALARAFLAKAHYNMTTTAELIERLKGCKNLRRICGWEFASQVPKEWTFSRAFGEFTLDRLSERVHAKVIEIYQSPRLVGHISRDSTPIEAREKPVPKSTAPKIKPKRKMGRPRKGEVPAPREPTTVIEKQQHMSTAELMKSFSTACNRGAKKNSKGSLQYWTGYKLHIDTADGGIPISCILSSASVQDSQLAIPLMKMTAERVTNLYDVMDAAYDCKIIMTESQLLGHVPIIDQNRRQKEKLEMDPAKKQRYKVRTTSERANSRLKDDFGGRSVRVKGPTKVMTHLMFGILVLTADQLLRLVT